MIPIPSHVALQQQGTLLHDMQHINLQSRDRITPLYLTELIHIKPGDKMWASSRQASPAIKDKINHE
jgi:hypothetical protein